jgi:alanine racemase
LSHCWSRFDGPGNGSPYEELPLGTKVTLIGREDEKEITATEVADYRGTINYEVVCLLSDRIPRDYTGEE